MSRGELEQAHGKAEATDFINRGIWKKVRDKPYPQYLKVREEATLEKQHVSAASGSRQHI